MTVLDASAAVAVLEDDPRGEGVLAALEGEAFVSVPDHFHVEVLAGFRRLAMRGALAPDAAERAIKGLLDLRAFRHATEELAHDIWALRHELTAYDAAYLALARSLDTKILTLDAGLAAVAAREGRLVPIA